jgi:hypothetical protein
METWTGDAWSVVTITDLSSGFASTARVTWSNAVGLSRLRYQDGYVFNWYKFSLSSGESKIYRITCDAAIQDVVDVWNGEYLPVGCAAAYGGIDYQDWTDYMNDDSRDTYMTVVTAPPYACLYFGFPVDVQGVKLWLLPSTYNSDKASLIVERYTGTVSASAWTAVSGLLDNTATGSYTLNKTGVVFWTAASKSEVFKTNMFEEQHYLYRFRWNDSIGFATSVRIWKAAGIPAPQKLLPYRFPFLFKGRPMLCGLNIANEGNRVDFGQVDSNAFFNGSDSSLGTDVDPLYFGETESLTAACEVFNRIGSNLYHVAVFTKDRETYILNGYDPETFQIMKLSSDTGCPAPKTMDTVEIGFGEQGNVRCAAIWLSYNGPVLCDVTNLYPMDADIECYFDALDSRCINWSAVSAAVGWVDQEQMEYNLCIPSGSGQTTNNVWLFLDVQTQKWWKRGAPQTPQAVIKVADTNGKIYIYGMCDDGIMRSLDQGEQYGSTVMSRYVETGEILPTGNMWDVTRLRRLKVLTGVVSETALLSITHAGSGASMGGGTAIASVSVNTQGAYVKDTESLNLLAWSHRLKFALSGGVTGRGLQLIAWGAEFMKEREDH